MATIQQIAEALRTHLSDDFPEIRFSGATGMKQMIEETGTIPGTALPALLIAAESGNFSQDGLTRELGITILLVDRFNAAQEDRQRSAWQALETLLGSFPAAGTQLEDAVLLPVRFDAVKTDAEHAGYLLKLKALHPAQ
jgi:hypothetical protein